MNSSTASVSRAPEIPNPLARADALEREITDLCAQINAASYRLLQLVAELDDEAPWGAWGLARIAQLFQGARLPGRRTSRGTRASRGAACCA